MQRASHPPGQPGNGRRLVTSSWCVSKQRDEQQQHSNTATQQHSNTTTLLSSPSHLVLAVMAIFAIYLMVIFDMVSLYELFYSYDRRHQQLHITNKFLSASLYLCSLCHSDDARLCRRSIRLLWLMSSMMSFVRQTHAATSCADCKTNNHVL